MRNLFVIALITLVSSGALAETKPKYGPTADPIAKPMHVGADYFRRSKNTDFWRLMGYYVPQFNGAACSVASVSMVINAALSHGDRTADDKVVSQQALLDRVKAEGWKSKITGLTARGTTLDQLGKIVEATFKEFGFGAVKVSVVHAEDASSKSLERLREVLKKNEASDRDFIIANFEQKVFTDDASAGHIAPVGAYDEQGRRVLILDPDREYYEPYWVSDEVFLKGMATRDVSAKVNRGYVWVSF